MLYIPIPNLSVLNVSIEFLVSCRKPLNLSMRGVVCGEECRGCSGHPYVSTTYFEMLPGSGTFDLRSGLGDAASNHPVVIKALGVINGHHECIRGAVGASGSPYAHIVVCLDTQIVPVNTPTRFTHFGFLWIRTSTGLPLLLMIPVVINQMALSRPGHFQSNHSSNHNRNIPEYTYT